MAKLYGDAFAAKLAILVPHPFCFHFEKRGDKPRVVFPAVLSMPLWCKIWNGKGSFKQGRVGTFLTEPFRYALSQDVTTGFFCTDFLHQTSLNKRID
jgi:hypothetical protein